MDNGFRKSTIDCYVDRAGKYLEFAQTHKPSPDMLERPGLHALLETLKAGDIQQVIVIRLDRLARNTMLSLWLMKEIKKLGAELVSIAEPGRWEDPTQKLLLTMVAAFAEFEKSLISSRLSGGRKTKAHQGGYAGGKAPVGYKECRGSKALAVDEEKVATDIRGSKLKDNTRPSFSLHVNRGITKDETIGVRRETVTRWHKNAFFIAELNPGLGGGLLLHCLDQSGAKKGIRPETIS